ncbi:MAG: aminotransferase class V-fold PLP-dependent enzyme, partial [Steroidobacteraceae bacterium]
VSSSAGMALMLHGLTWQAGDEVLTLADEFPNQLYVSTLLQRYGAQLRTVPWPQFYDSVTPRTRVALLSSVNYATGFRAPLEQISQFLAQRGVLLYVDGTQSVGALQFDVARIRPAMLSVNAYKWLMSPNGAGFAYVSPQLRPLLAPSVVGWRSDIHWRDVQQLHHGAPRFAESAERYEGGMPAFPSLYAMVAVIELLLELGPRQIEARVLQLAAQTRAMLRELGATVNDDESQIVTAVLPGSDAATLAAKLKSMRILTSARRGRLRISPHLYNCEEDIHGLRSALIGLQARSTS